MKQDIKAVLWDMDGTLADSEALHLSTLVAVLNQHGIEAGDDLHASIFGKTGREVHTYCCERFGIDFDYGPWSMARARHFLSEAPNMQARPGALDVYHAVRATGTRQAIVSNSSRMLLEAGLRALDLQDPQLISISANDVRFGKPDPEPYQRAAWLLRVIPEAFAIAASGRPGPVLIDVPKDVQNERVDVAKWPEPGTAAPPARAPDDALERAAALVDAAKRPILYLGGGIVHSGAAPVAVALAERSSLPTVMTLMGLGALPADHALSLGMLGMHAAPYTNLALDECDLLIAVGARFDDRATGKLAAFCPRAAVIHVDVDAAELGKLRTPELAIAADARDVLERLLPRVRARCRPAWLARVGELKRAHPLEMPGADSLRAPYGLIRAVAAALDDDAIVTTDVGQHQMWVAQAFPLRRPRAWITSGGLGTMGFGLPAAIGAALAEPERTVVCFSGDGSILMNLQELATAAEEGVNVKIVLMNNRSLGLVYQQQTLFYGRRTFASEYRKMPDFVALARAFHLDAVDLDRAREPARTLRAALRQPGPGLIHASIDTAEQVLPMVPPGAANTAMIVRERNAARESSA